MFMSSETSLEEMVEQEAIHETYKSKSLILLAKHPMTPLINRRTLRWNLLLVFTTLLMLIFCIVCGAIVGRHLDTSSSSSTNNIDNNYTDSSSSSSTSTSNTLNNYHHESLSTSLLLTMSPSLSSSSSSFNTTTTLSSRSIYTQIQLSFNSSLVHQFKNRLSSVGLLALGVQNGLELTTSVLYMLLLSLLLLSVAKRLQSDKRCHVSRNQLFIKVNRSIIMMGYVMAWFIIVPCLLHTLSHLFIFIQLMSPLSTVPSQLLSVLIGICMLLFLVLAVLVGGVYIVLGGLYILTLLLISRRRGYYFRAQ